MNKTIWNDRFICIDKKSVYRCDLVNLGIVKVGDLITDNNLFLHEDPSVQISPDSQEANSENVLIFHFLKKLWVEAGNIA